MANLPFWQFPSFRVAPFRHSAIFIDKESDIENPEDLNGKTTGELALYGHDAGIMPKGMPMDEFGFKPETCRWIVGGLDWPLKQADFASHTHPSNVEVCEIAKGKALGAMLEAGEIDALISAQSVYKGFCDSKKAAEDQYKHGLIFNSMGIMFPWFSRLAD